MKCHYDIGFFKGDFCPRWTNSNYNWMRVRACNDNFFPLGNDVEHKLCTIILMTCSLFVLTLSTMACFGSGASSVKVKILLKSFWRKLRQTAFVLRAKYLSNTICNTCAASTRPLMLATTLSR